MLIDKDLSINDLIDDQKNKWIYNFLRAREWIDRIPHDQFLPLSPEEVKIQVVNALHSTRYSHILPITPRYAAMTIYNILSSIYERSKIPSSESKFIFKLNQRLKNLIWLLIRNIVPSFFTGEPTKKIPQEYDYKKLSQYLLPGPIYSHYTLQPHPLSDTEKNTAIKDFLFIWEASAEFKRQYLKDFREQITHIQTFNTAFRWLDCKNAEQCEWAYRYLEKRGIFQENYPTGSTTLLFDAIVVSFDYWETSYEAKKLFLNDIRRAWSVQKFREKQVGKKPYNFVMKKNMAKMLDNLAKAAETSKSEIVEQLITNAHSSLQDKKTKT